MFYITGFKPFKSRPKNGSETLVKSLSESPGLRHIAFRVLDVAWESFDAFFREIESEELEGIIGFGEGKTSTIVIEGIGRNTSSGTDEYDVTREDVIIDPSLASSYCTRIRIPDVEVEHSDDAGVFLCNYELFHINSLDIVTSAFIHLPPQQDTPDDEYVSRLLPTIEKIILHNLMVKK